MTADCWIYALDDPLPDDVAGAALLGGKGMSLRRLAAANVAVPRGFTITTNACRATLSHDGNWPDGLDQELATALRNLERDRGRLSGEVSGSLRLAVRSGAEISMPGMLETILDCEANLPALGDAINTVFRSWHNARASAWRQQHNLDDSAGTAVTVQEMIEPICSGVLFTTAPGTASTAGAETPADILVEAVTGRGDALVSGQKTPHRFVINRSSLQFRLADGTSSGDATDADAALAALQMTETQLRDLCATALRLEVEFGEALDIEWGLTEGACVFFQARPVTGAVIARSTQSDEPSEIHDAESDRQTEAYREAEVGRLTPLLASGRVLVRHNIGETLPSPTPMTWRIVRRMMSGSGAFGRLYRTLGYAPGRRVRRKGFLELAAGRIYADPDCMITLFADEWPLCHDLAELRQNPQKLDEPPRHFDPDRTHPLLLLLLPHLVWVVLRSARRIRRLMRDADRRFHDEALPAWLQWVDREQNRDLAESSNQELLVIFEERTRKTVDEFAAESLLPGTLGAIAAADLHRQVSSFCEAEVAIRFREMLLSSISSPLQQRKAELLGQLASRPDALPEFIAAFGHRGPGEMELALPRWREHPPQTGSESRQDFRPPARAETLDEFRYGTEPAEQLRTLLTEAGVPQQADQLIEQLETARSLLPLRESGRHYLMLGFELIRGVLEELGRRFQLGDGIYFLEPEELPQLAANESSAVPASVEEVISRRRADHQSALRLVVPDFLDTESVTEIVVRDRRRTGTLPESTFEADVLAPGRCTGVVVRVNLVELPREIPSGSVLVADAIDPGLTPLLLQSAGIIVERGGMLSHGAVIARQLGIPAVRCPAAMRTLPEGQCVSIDSGTAQVSLIERDAS